MSIVKQDLRPRIAAETFTAKFALADHDTKTMQFHGMGSVFGVPVDTFPPTVIMHGAFSKTLAEQGKRVKILWQHDTTDPIGRPVSMKETEHGLDLHAQLDPVPNGQRAMLQIQSGTLTDLSIGFDPLNWDMMPVSRLGKLGIDMASLETYGLSQNDPVRALKEVRLWEVSVVTFGAQRAATLTAFALAFRDLPLAGADLPWSPEIQRAATGRVRAWAGDNFERLCRAYLLAGTDAESCRYQIADVVDNRLVVIPQAVITVGERVAKASLPGHAGEYAREHLAAYCHKMGRLAPWEEGSVVAETFRGRRLSKKSRGHVDDVKKKLQDALAAIGEFEGYADENEQPAPPALGTAAADLGTDGHDTPSPAPDTPPQATAGADKPAEALVYMVEERDGKFCVVKSGTGDEVVGSPYDTKDEADEHMKELAKGVEPAEKNALSIESYRDAIRAALLSILGEPYGPGAQGWEVEATFPDSVIVNRGGQRYRYPVTNDGTGNMRLGQPVEVKVEYLPAEGHAAQRPEKKIETAPTAEVLSRTEIRLKEMALAMGAGGIVT
jgi:hypothetical protein